jgi:HSP20 family protein
MATEKIETKTEKQTQGQTQEQRGELVRRDPTQMSREPFQRMRDFMRDPFEAMRDLMRWDPFREIAPFTGGQGGWSPDFDVRETKDSYVFEADLPGAKKENIDISLVGNRLQVTGKRDEEQETREDTYYAYERSYGTFTRTFTLPDTADTEHISSNLSDGVLTLVVPKTAESKARKIQIGSGDKH